MVKTSSSAMAESSPPAQNRFPQFMKDGEIFETRTPTSLEKPHPIFLFLTPSDEEDDGGGISEASQPSSARWRDCIGQLDDVLKAQDLDTNSHFFATNTNNNAPDDMNPDNTVTLRRNKSNRSTTSASNYARKMQDAYQELYSSLGTDETSGHRLRPPTISGVPLTNQNPSGTWPRRRHRLSSSLRNIDTMFDPNSSDGTEQAALLRPGRFPVASERASPMNGSKSDLFLAWEDDNFGRLSSQLADLDKKLHNMTTNQTQIESQNLNLQRENKMLRERLMYMEDQLREDDRKFREQINREKELFNERLIRLNKERQQEVDEFRESFHKLELENASIRLELTKIRAEAERQKLEKERVEEKLDSSDNKLASLTEETDRFREYSRKKIEELKKARDSATKSMEDMHREVVELRSRGKILSSNNFGTASAAGGIPADDLPTKYREMQDLVKRLTIENRDLSEQLDEAKAELFTRSVEEGRRLLLRGQMSWEAELNECSMEELIVLVTKERDTSSQLRDYINQILSRIMEEYPTLLEKHS